MTRASIPAALALGLALAGCASLEPALPQAEPGIPLAWPLPATTDQQADATPATAVADIGWRDFFNDDELEAHIARALANNRDLRTAILDVERARGLYRVQRSQRLPSVGAAVEARRTGGDEPEEVAYSASAGIAGFELDLFGRVKNLSDAALRRFLATEEARRAAQLALIAEVANAWITLAADRELVRVSRASLDTHEASYELTRKRLELGAVSRLDLAQASTLVETARADAARYEGRAGQARNALQLLVGAPLDESSLPGGFGMQHVGALRPLPAGLPSDVLLRRPDVRQAEETLRAENANIGAARAAFFPSISLTGAVGTASTELSGLFSGGAFAWSLVPRIDIPIFQAGRLAGNLEAAKAGRDMALARYEKAIQAGFREVADALTLSRTFATQRAAQEALLQSATQAEELSRARYEGGRDSFLVLLDAQRTLYAAQQALVTTRLAEQANRVTLYKALGGGWKEGAA